MPRDLILTTLLFCCAVAVCPAAQQDPDKSVMHPAANSVELYAAFFQFQEALSREVSKRLETDGIAGEGFKNAACVLLGLDADDFSTAGEVAREVNEQLRALRDEAATLRSSAGKPLDPAKAISYANRRREAVSDAVRRLERRLSKQGWARLQSYLNDTFRMTIVGVKVR